MLRNGYLRVGVGLFVVLGLALVAEVTGFRDFVASGQLQLMIERSGPLAPLLFISIYAVATILFVPGTPLTLLGGALFGPIFGSIYVILGATIGAVGAFLLARYVGGSWLTSGAGTILQRLRTYDEQLVRNGFVTVLILRLVPLFPFNGLNFCLGLTRLRLRIYILATFIGIIPGTVAYVYFGASLASFNLHQIIGAIIGLVAVSLLGKYLLSQSNKRSHANEI
jgi:uncharacterized membrane protein YdjX (TVP38/TMEM64 family)